MKRAILIAQWSATLFVLLSTVYLIFKEVLIQGILDLIWPAIAYCLYALLTLLPSISAILYWKSSPQITENTEKNLDDFEELTVSKFNPWSIAVVFQFISAGYFIYLIYPRYPSAYTRLEVLFIGLYIPLLVMVVSILHFIFYVKIPKK